MRTIFTFLTVHRRDRGCDHFKILNLRTQFAIQLNLYKRFLNTEPLWRPHNKIQASGFTTRHKLATFGTKFVIGVSNVPFLLNHAQPKALNWFPLFSCPNVCCNEVDCIPSLDFEIRYGTRKGPTAECFFFINS